jgi:hypothetical protein
LKRRILIALAILVVGITVSIIGGYALLSSIPAVAFPVVQIDSGFVPDGGTYYAVYRDMQGRVFEVGTSPRSSLTPLGVPLAYLDGKSGPRVYPYLRRFPDRFPIAVKAAPCSSLEKELHEFSLVLAKSSRPENRETATVINRRIEKNKKYCER